MSGALGSYAKVSKASRARRKVFDNNRKIVAAVDSHIAGVCAGLRRLGGAAAATWYVT